MPNGPYNIKPQRYILGHSQDQVWGIAETANRALRDEVSPAPQPRPPRRDAPGNRSRHTGAYYGVYGPGMPQMQQQGQHHAPTMGDYQPQQGAFVPEPAYVQQPGYGQQLDYGQHIGCGGQEPAYDQEPAYNQHFPRAYNAPPYAAGPPLPPPHPYGGEDLQQIFGPQHGAHSGFEEDATVGEPPVEAKPETPSRAGCRDSNASSGSSGSIDAQAPPYTQSAPASISQATAPPLPDRDADATPPPPQKGLSAAAPMFHPLSALPHEASKYLDQPESYYRDHMPATTSSPDPLTICLGPKQELPVNKAPPASYARGLNTVHGLWKTNANVERPCFPGLLSCERSAGGRPIPTRIDSSIVEPYRNMRNRFQGKKTVLQQGNAYLHVLPAKVTDLECQEQAEMWEEGASSALAAARWVLLK